jgi:DNA-binding transcriptional LysR family regulator
MNLKHLQYFRVLAHLEHYTQAAEELFITQPSLSHAISELEKELGTYLFEKQGRNVKLTKYGHFFLTYVDKALDELEKGEKDLRELVSPHNGTIDLAFIYTLGSHFVPNTLKNFLLEEENKNISFNLSQSTTKNVIKGLKSGKFDLGFCSFVENEPDIEFIPLLEEELVLIVNKNHPLAMFDSIDLRDTEKYPFILFSEDSGLRPTLDKLFEDADIVPKIKCKVEEDSAVAGLVSIDYGIAIIPKIWILDHFDIKVLHIKNLTRKRYIYIAYIKNKYLSPAVNSFKDFVINNRKVSNLC